MENFNGRAITRTLRSPPTPPGDMTMKADAINPLVTTEEAAAMLGLQPGTLRVWRSKQPRPDQPAYVKVGKSVRYSPGELARWAASRTHDPAGAAGIKDRDPGRQRGRPGPR